MALRSDLCFTLWFYNLSSSFPIYVTDPLKSHISHDLGLELDLDQCFEIKFCSGLFLG